MVNFVVDRSLDVLLGEIDAVAPNRSKASDGSIGDPDHQTRVSAHNPEDTEDSSDGNDPDNQVDARDFTHDPANGADMHQVTEIIRRRRDRRIRLVIFYERIFSSYATATRKAWEWGPYSGENDHTRHAHVETNDNYNDTLNPWGVEEEMGMAITDADITRIAAGMWGALLGSGSNRRSTGAILQDAADESDIPMGDLDELALADVLSKQILANLEEGFEGVVRRVVREEIDRTKMAGAFTS